MLTVTGPLLLAVAVLGPAAGGLWATLPRRRSGRGSIAATRIALVAAVVVAVVSGVGTPVAVAVDQRPLVEVDRLAGILMVFVAGATLVVQTFAGRALRGDPLRHRFFAASGVAATGTMAVVVAADLWILVLGWMVVSAGTVALLHHDGRPAARAGARRAATAFLVGDGVLLAATVVASAVAGPVTLRPEPLQALVASDPGVGPVALVGVMAAAAVVAAVTRSALPPFQGWLPLSVAAPTPSSAVLHAGVVNGSGLLLIRFAPLLAVSPLATAAAVAAGCAGVLVGTAVTRARSDVKGALAWSTVAQMGFMAVQCVTGLLGPALVHLMAHGMYKANLFLGSGSTVGQTHPPSPTRSPAPGRVAAVAAVTILSVGVAWLVIRPEALAGAVGLVFTGFIAATVAQATASWLRARTERSRVDLAAAAALVAATTAALGLAELLEVWLAPSLPAVDPSLALAGALALALTAAVGLGLSVAARHPAGPVATLADRAYLWALHLGDPSRLVPVTAHQEART